MLYPELGEDIFRLQNDMIFNDEKIESLISEIFYNINDNFNDYGNYINYIKDRAIFTVKNDDVDNINEQIINIFPGESQVYFSADSVYEKESVH